MHGQQPSGGFVLGFPRKEEVSTTMSLFARAQLAPADPILGLTEAFNADKRAEKVNLGVGVYLGDDGKLPLMTSVREAQERLTAELESAAAPANLASAATSHDSRLAVLVDDGRASTHATSLACSFKGRCEFFGRCRDDDPPRGRAPGQGSSSAPCARRRRLR